MNPEKTYTEEQVKELMLKAFHNGYYIHYEEINGEGKSSENPLPILKLINKELNIEEPKEERIPITIATIKATCGWSEYCETTGANPYMIKEFSMGDHEVLNPKKSHAIKLGLIKI